MVTPELVAATIAHVAGETVEVGPMHAGPGDAAVNDRLNSLDGIAARRIDVLESVDEIFTRRLT